MKTKSKKAPPPLHNRIAGMLDEEEDDLSNFPEPPKSEREREEFWNDTLFDTIACLRAKLRSKDQQISLTAAQEIVALSRTRMRHGKRIDGTGDGTMTYEESEEMLDRTVRRNTPITKPAPSNETATEAPVVEPADPTEDTISPAEAAACETHVQRLQEVSGQWAAEMNLGDGLGMTRRQAIEFFMRMIQVTQKTAVELDPALLEGALRKMMLHWKEEQDAKNKDDQNPANSAPPKASVSG